jgi:hypothetical protein
MSTDIDPDFAPEAAESDRTAEQQVRAIRTLNDALRTNPSPSRGEVYLTRGVADRGAAFVANALAKVQSFSAFTPENDPHGEHDLGAVDVHGEHVFWNIDYYDRASESASPDPADPEQTRRVLTILLAEEY